MLSANYNIGNIIALTCCKIKSYTRQIVFRDINRNNTNKHMIMFGYWAEPRNVNFLLKECTCGQLFNEKLHKYSAHALWM